MENKFYLSELYEYGLKHLLQKENKEEFIAAFSNAIRYLICKSVSQYQFSYGDLGLNDMLMQQTCSVEIMRIAAKRELKLLIEIVDYTPDFALYNRVKKSFHLLECGEERLKKLEKGGFFKRIANHAKISRIKRVMAREEMLLSFQELFSIVIADYCSKNFSRGGDFYQQIKFVGVDW